MTVAKYHAPRREEQAAATRSAILSAAARLFARHGYAATTMAAVAEEARVTPKSVYALADKPGLLRHAVAIADAAGRTGEDVAAALLRRYPIERAFEEAAATEP